MSKKNIKEYRAWQAMKARCYAPSNKESTYQERGIIVCDSWKNSYECFIADVGNAPGDTYSLDRIDNSKGYCPENCRWADRNQQARNRGTFNILVAYQGEVKVLKEWCLQLGLKYDTVHHRMQKLMLPFEQAMLDDPFDKMLEYKGKRQTLKQWSNELNIPIRVLYDRQFEKWDVIRMFEQPIKQRTMKI